MGWCWKSIKSSANQTIKIYRGNPTISLKRAPVGLCLRLFPACNWTEPGWVTQSNERFTWTKCHWPFVRVLGLALMCNTKRERFQRMNFRVWKEYLFQVGRFESIVLQSMWLVSLQRSGWKRLWEFLCRPVIWTQFCRWGDSSCDLYKPLGILSPFVTCQGECKKPGNSPCNRMEVSFFQCQAFKTQTSTSLQIYLTLKLFLVSKVKISSLAI